MLFKKTSIDGVYVIELEPHKDERGFFARTYCRNEFISHELDPDIAQCSLSYSKCKGTLRGLHYQAEPSEETKLVRCVKGKVFDVVVDIRPNSPTFGRWLGTELSEDNFRALYIPKGCAHGFQTLEDNVIFLYQISSFYDPSAARTLRWDDPKWNIQWPRAENLIISSKDKNAPMWHEK